MCGYTDRDKYTDTDRLDRIHTHMYEQSDRKTAKRKEKMRLTAVRERESIFV